MTLMFFFLLLFIAFEVFSSFSSYFFPCEGCQFPLKKWIFWSVFGS